MPYTHRKPVKIGVIRVVMSVRVPRCVGFFSLVLATLFVLLLKSPSIRGAGDNLGVVDCDSGNFSCSNYNYPSVGVCVNGSCYCNGTSLGECFSFSSENKSCVLNTCYEYLPEQTMCRKGTKSRTAAILLSVFLINFGAANFYIERFELAIPQIILGLFLCFFQFGSCAVAAARDDETSLPCIICCSLNSLVSLLFLAWWIADLVIFVTNTRTSGDGCLLY